MTTLGRISLFLLHALWPFLWIWATMYRADRGWGMMNAEERQNVKKALIGPEEQAVTKELAEVKARLAALESKVIPNASKEG